MTLRVWWLFVLTETTLSLSPGPAVLFVISQGLAVGGRRATWAALGIVSGNVVWFALSALGIATVVAASGAWFAAIKWIGAAYLVWLAIQPFVGRGSALTPAGTPAAASGRRSIWARGFLLQLTNPKALVFFTALLPQFVRADGDVARQSLILGTTSIACELPILILYAALAGRGAELVRNPRFARVIDYAIAVLLITAALGIALSGEAGGDVATKPTQARNI